MDQSENLKRINSTSPSAIKHKGSKKTKLSDEQENGKTNHCCSHCNELEEDIKLVKRECDDLKVENGTLRENLQNLNGVKMENTKLSKQLKDKEIESVQA